MGHGVKGKVKKELITDELPRRKRTGYEDHPHKANFATSGGELNPNKIND